MKKLHVHSRVYKYELDRRGFLLVYRHGQKYGEVVVDENSDRLAVEARTLVLDADLCNCRACRERRV